MGFGMSSISMNIDGWHIPWYMCTHLTTVRGLKLNEDGDGLITEEELQNGFQTCTDFALMMSQMDLTSDDMSAVFAMLDDDASGCVTYEEFVAELYKMKTQEVRPILLFIKGKQNEIRLHLDRHLTGLREEVKHMCARMNKRFDAEDDKETSFER